MMTNPILDLDPAALEELLTAKPGLSGEVAEARVADAYTAFSEVGSARLTDGLNEDVRVDFQPGEGTEVVVAVLDRRTGTVLGAEVTWDPADPWSDPVAAMSRAVHLVDVERYRANHLELPADELEFRLAWASAREHLVDAWVVAGHVDSSRDVADELAFAATVTGFLVADHGYDYQDALAIVAQNRPALVYHWTSGAGAAEVSGQMVDALSP